MDGAGVLSEVGSAVEVVEPGAARVIRASAKWSGPVLVPARLRKVSRER